MFTLAAPSDLTKVEREVMRLLRERLHPLKSERINGSLSIKLVLNDGNVANKETTITIREK